MAKSTSAMEPFCGNIGEMNSSRDFAVSLPGRSPGTVPTAGAPGTVPGYEVAGMLAFVFLGPK